MRNTDVVGLVETLAAADQMMILSVRLTIYGINTLKKGTPSLALSLMLIGRKKDADRLQMAQGWGHGPITKGDFFFDGPLGVAWPTSPTLSSDCPQFSM
ncbi:hypothetical protein L7F22_031787 [Adiantum nelumboides]|nr:hypothetical protein [Adiantum nelumboides]